MPDQPSIPITPGMAIANEHGPSGTLGLIVRSTETDEVFALSCSHVMARFGIGVGDPNAEVIVRPGGGSTEERRIGVLTNMFSRVRIDRPNPEDVALARLITRE